MSTASRRRFIAQVAVATLVPRWLEAAKNGSFANTDTDTFTFNGDWAGMREELLIGFEAARRRADASDRKRPVAVSGIDDRAFVVNFRHPK